MTKMLAALTYVAGGLLITAGAWGSVRLFITALGPTQTQDADLVTTAVISGTISLFAGFRLIALQRARR